ncbi:hypothetical protein J6590_100893 [Homalodisca vitripennis]|nr:hypothetical protein J6590_100893 [Homalodisca vitripennis]
MDSETVVDLTQSEEHSSILPTETATETATATAADTTTVYFFIFRYVSNDEFLNIDTDYRKFMDDWVSKFG